MKNLTKEIRLGYYSIGRDIWSQCDNDCYHKVWKLVYLPIVVRVIENVEAQTEFQIIEGLTK